MRHREALRVTKTPPLFGACDGETAQHHDGKRVGHIASQAPRRGIEIDPAAGKCVIADDLSFAADET